MLYRILLPTNPGYRIEYCNEIPPNALEIEEVYYEPLPNLPVIYKPEEIKIWVGGKKKEKGMHGWGPESK